MPDDSGEREAVSIGVDTGGTYTDAVLFNRSSGVLASAKALTTRHDLALGIAEAVSRVRQGYAGPISFLSVSTTLATNALAEKSGAPVCVVLLGYPAHAVEEHIAEQAFGDDPVVHLAGGHTVDGDERAPLATDGLREVAREYAHRVQAFAVSGYFSVRNPEHEIRAGGMLQQLTGLPVSYGHELSSRLHAGRRALTTAWNARLIPLLTELVVAVREVMAAQNLDCPLMMVKGDGSLVSAKTAQQHPVQTILSGPAASVVGAQYLQGIDTACVVDIGGTTTDIAIIRDGRPVVSSDGARVGGLKTMVPAVQMHTFALGGDSAVRLADNGDITFGPDRIVPASLALTRFPCSRDAFEDADETDGVFLSLSQRHRNGGATEVSPSQQRLVDAINGRLVSRAGLLAVHRSRFLVQRDLKRLILRGVLECAGFTPSDAAHVLHRQATWTRDAAVLAAVSLYRQAYRLPALRDSATASTGRLFPEVSTFREVQIEGEEAVAAEVATRVLGAFVSASARAIVVAVIAEGCGNGVTVDPSDPVARSLVEPAVRHTPRNRIPESEEGAAPGAKAWADGVPAPDPEISIPAGELLSTRFTLNCPIVAVGAPAACYYHDVAQVLGTSAVVPNFSEVANAIGAVAGEVRSEVTVRVTPLDGGERYRLHAPDGTQDFATVDTARRAALEQAEESVRRRAGDAGAGECELSICEHRNTSIVNEGEMLIELVVRAEAIGRPHIGRTERNVVAGERPRSLRHRPDTDPAR